MSYFSFFFLQKERDLELAAKIGQTLLTKNQELSEKNDVLEEQLNLLSEKVMWKHVSHKLYMDSKHKMKKICDPPRVF